MNSESSDRILVTSALPYANGPLHIGHLAGAYLPADIYCRFQRLRGKPLVYICGSDEHGVPIVLRAREEGISPQQVVDRYHDQMQTAFSAFGMSFDYFGRTSGETHARTSQEFFSALDSKGAFIQKTESHLYDATARLFLADRFVRGTCPHCGYDDAYGDQCEKCGRSLSPKDLVNPRSAISNATPEVRETTHWYLPLGKCQQELETWIGTHGDWKVNVLGQVRSWLNEGLGDRAVTRDQSWGVPVPQASAEKANVDATGKVLYVWFDAPIGYISFTREWAQLQGDPDAWKLWWQDKGTSLVHFIGKDNIVFHCLIFPAMLQAHGEYVLPANVPANEFLNIEGKKLSTSRGWAIWLHEFLQDFPADYLRFSLTKMLPETKDSDFSFADFQAHVNNELADTVGNLLNRSLTFAVRNFDNKVPALENPSEADLAMLAEIRKCPELVASHLESFRFREALCEIMNLARYGNKYFNDSAPWATRKSNIQACGNTIHVSVQLCASLSILLDPFLPFSAASIRKMLDLNGVRCSASGIAGSSVGHIGWNDAGLPLIEAGHSLGTIEILFQKIEDDAIAKQRAKLDSQVPVEPQKDLPYNPMAETITYDDFAKLDLRVGLVKACEPVKKSKKLLRCDVDLGFETRQILAGVALHIKPEDLIGRKVVVVANLAVRKMMGHDSHGMLLMATDRQDRITPVLVGPEFGEPGSVVR
ncbi:MAG: methionine--tRNA ligase [Polyangiaceae bacterium]|nr:methionine--tRNA ligase [Polyangiaceae bacterium]